MGTEFRVFVVDDEPFMRDFFRGMLEGEFAVDTFASAEACRQCLAGGVPDLFVLDVGLPGLDGYGFCRELKSLAETAAVPVIFVSGHDTVEARLAGYEAGGDDFLCKPFDPDELVHKLRVAQRARGSRRAAEDARRKEGYVAALAKLGRHYELILNATLEGMLGLDAEGRVVFANAAAARLLGQPADAMIGRSACDLLHGGPAPASRGGPPCVFDGAVLEQGEERSGGSEFLAGDGHLLPVEFNLAPIVEGGRATGGVLVFRDMTARRQAERDLAASNERLAAAQAQLMQSEKMAAIGQLAAGIAHEINNPVGFVASNLAVLDGYLRDLLDLAQSCAALEPRVAGTAEWRAIESARQRMDLDFVRQDAPVLVRESIEGVDRVKKIVADLKEFSHPGGNEDWQDADLHRTLDSAINIVWNEIKYKAELTRNYGEVPRLRCLPSQLAQVFMNLLVNAGHAIADHGSIRVSTGSGPGEVWVEVADTGTGIAPEHLGRIFEPFFTTKPVGKGTGLGLSLSYAIVQKHRGRIDVTSEPGKGTAFRVILPTA